MNIVIAPQGFKGNLTALEVARAIEEGIKRVVPDAMTIIKPMADGGEGTVQALVDATGGDFQQILSHRVAVLAHQYHVVALDDHHRDYWCVFHYFAGGVPAVRGADGINA